MQIQFLQPEVWRAAAHRSAAAPSHQPSLANEPGVLAQVALDCHALRIALERTAIVIVVMGDILEDGSIGSSTAQAIRSMKKIERQPDGSLFLYVVSTALTTRLGCAFNPPVPKEAAGVHTGIARDSAIERLTRALLSIEDAQGGFDEVYANAVGVAIITRLITLQARSDASSNPRSNTGLQKWRLHRVIDYIDAHLGEPVTLADMAQVAGLTRMHFARQFRVATGVRPHEYLLRRRIESAQELLRTSRSTLVEIALSVGFQAQPHFTTIFKRIVGETPHRWRTSMGIQMVIAPPSPQPRRPYSGINATSAAEQRVQ
jgi:AraC-like DNA-binding protein